MILSDWVIVFVYLLAVGALGLWVARGQRSQRDYFLGGRDLSWWVAGLSIVATETSALTFIGVPALAIGKLQLTADGSLLAEGGNLLFMQIAIGYVIARVIVAVVMVPHYFKGDVYTPYQVLTRAFGPPPRYTAAAFALFSMCFQAGFRVYVTAIPLTLVLRTHYSSWGVWESILLFTAVSVLYTTAGGIKAVVWTDMIQFFVLLAGGLFALFYVPTLLTGTHAAPSGAEGWDALLEIGGHKLTFWNWGTVARGSDQGFWSWIGANLARVLGGDFNIWMGLVGATIGVMVSHGADQLNVQRVLACRNVRDGRRALILSSVIIAPQFLLFLFVGVGLYAFYAVGGFDFGGLQPWDATLSKGSPRADFVFPIFIVSQVPSPIRGFLIAGVLAAAMSSLTSALTAISSVALVDIVDPLRPRRRSDAQQLRRGRLATLIAGFVLVGVAWWAKDAELIFNTVFRFAGVFSGAKLGALLYAMWARRGRPAPVVAGMVASALVMTAIVVLGKTTRFHINWPWYSMIGSTVCLLVAHIGSGKAPLSSDRDVDRPVAGETADTSAPC